MRIQDVREAIRNGDFDHRLDRFQNMVNLEVKDRRRELSEALADDFAVGQRVITMPGNYKPRYMFNKTGTVTKVESPWVWVELDEPIRRSGGGFGKVVRHVGISAINLEPLPDEPSIQ